MEKEPTKAEVVEEAKPQATEEVKPEHASEKKKVNPLLIVCIVLAVLLLGTGVYAFGPFRDREVATEENNTETPSQNNTNTEESTETASNDNLFLSQWGLAGCTEDAVSFTSPPIVMKDLGYIEPMGKMLDGHVTPTDHVYVHPKNGNAADNTYSAIMPADGTIVAVAAMPGEYIGDTNQQTASEDHRLVVMHSCQHYSIFIHIHKLDDALKNVVGTLAPNESKTTSIKLKAGERIGGIGSQGFDWTLVDTKTKLSGFITPKLYDGESWKIHSIDPLSVYSGETKTSLEALSLRSVEPYGGKIDYDKAGSLVGNWFREGTDGYFPSGAADRYWDGHLSVVPDYVDPNYTIVSIGNWDKDKAAQFLVKGTVDPSTITKASGPVKYELMSFGYVTPAGASWTGMQSFTKGVMPSASSGVKGTIMLEVMDGEKLKVEKFVGKTAAQVSAFTSSAQTYYR